MNVPSSNTVTAIVGDIIRFHPKFYGHHWACNVFQTGIVLEVIAIPGCHPGVAALVQHPEDSTPATVFAFFDDFELVENE